MFSYLRMSSHAAFLLPYNEFSHCFPVSLEHVLFSVEHVLLLHNEFSHCFPVSLEHALLSLEHVLLPYNDFSHCFPVSLEHVLLLRSNFVRESKRTPST